MAANSGGPPPVQNCSRTSKAPSTAESAASADASTSKPSLPASRARPQQRTNRADACALAATGTVPPLHPLCVLAIALLLWLTCARHMHQQGKHLSIISCGTARSNCTHRQNTRRQASDKTKRAKHPERLPRQLCKLGRLLSCTLPPAPCLHIPVLA